MINVSSRNYNMHVDESADIEKKISKLIGLYNVYCDIEDTFNKSKILSKFWNDAKKEVFSHNNQGLGMIYYRALKKIATTLAAYQSTYGNIDIGDYDEEDYDE